jgi:hypothetical protein
MKKILLCLVLFTTLLTEKSFAQDTMRTIIHPAKINYIGLYIAPEYHFGQLNNAFTSLGGASAMVIFNKTLAVGVTASHSLDRRFSPSGVSPLFLNAFTGGLKLEYTVKPNSAVHLTFPLVAGMGFARADSLAGRRGPRQGDFNNFNDGTRKNERYAFIQPGIQLEVNLMRYAKFFAGASYRAAWADGRGTAQLPSNTLQGASFDLGVKIGYFDYWIKRKKPAIK